MADFSICLSLLAVVYMYPIIQITLKRVKIPKSYNMADEDPCKG